ncbi:hypothetical protein IMCC26134_01580 [Verrucomicrobia bacterium IMCC26134]|jgi:CheY-like chemotaxis protein|nr:hypothetical protein IMCC26134_01580 [Verrucomicrobia bacterium IMCC26134]
MKILIVEDEESIRYVLKEILEMNGHTVTLAANGVEGLAAANAAPPELVLCDINMPLMNGYQMLEEIQKKPELREIPFVFLTAVADRSSLRRGMEQGASDFITKPFTESEITNVITAISRRRQPLRDRVEQLVSQHTREVGADWSHELMTPLNGVLGGLALIEAEADTIKPESLRELLGIVRIGAERQLALSSKLVRYYELERLKNRPVNQNGFCNAVDHIVSVAGEIARKSKRVEDLTVRTEPSILVVDGSLLKSALTELVANAFFFTAAGQSVTVTGKHYNGRYLIEVIDCGVGMTHEECASVAAFNQFGRKRHNQQGLGLGLAIARSAAEVIGGKFSIQPGPGGRGLHATLDLPCTRASAAPFH